MGSVFALASLVLEYAPKWIDAGMDAYELYTKTQAVIDEHRVPGNAEWDALDAKVKALQAIVRDTSHDA